MRCCRTSTVHTHYTFLALTKVTATFVGILIESVQHKSNNWLTQ